MAFVVVWAVVASVTTCLNETPGFFKLYAAALPSVVNTAQVIMQALAVIARPLVHADGSCQPSTLAWSLGVACALYLVGVLLLEYGGLRPRVAASIVLAVWVASHAVLLAMPGLLSTDVFAYASYGRIAGLQGGNPYIDAGATPGEVQPGESAPNGSTVYGPLWTRIDATVARAVPSGNPVQQLFAYRLVATLAQLANLAMVWWLTGQWVRLGALPSPRVAAFALFAWSPLALFELGGDAHNEAVMLTCVLLAFVLLTLALRPSTLRSSRPAAHRLQADNRSSSTGQSSAAIRPRGAEQPPQAENTIASSTHRASETLAPPRPQTGVSSRNALWIAALLVLILGALVKFVPLAIALVVVIVWLTQLRRNSQRIAYPALVALGAVALTLLVAWPWLQTTDILRPVLGIARGGAYYRYAWQDSPADILKIKLIVPRMPDVHDSIRVDLARGIVWGITRVAFVAVLAFIVWRLLRRHIQDAGTTLRTIAEAATWVVLAATLLLLTQVLAWYFLWTLPMVALLGWRSRVARIALFFGLSFCVAFYLGEFQPFGTPYLTVYALIALALIALSELLTSTLTRATSPAP